MFERPLLYFYMATSAQKVGVLSNVLDVSKNKLVRNNLLPLRMPVSWIQMLRSDDKTQYRWK